MNSALFWVNIILLVIIIALIIWLLARGSGATTLEKQKVNQSCTQTSDCNTGLVCSVTPGTGGVCKVASGGVCSDTAECGTGLTCQKGVCLGKGGSLNDPCPCGEGLTCVNNVCKVKVGGPCTDNTDCANDICQENVCVVSDATLLANPTCGGCGMADECYSRYDDSVDKYYYSSSSDNSSSSDYFDRSRKYRSGSNRKRSSRSHTNSKRDKRKNECSSRKKDKSSSQSRRSKYYYESDSSQSSDVFDKSKCKSLTTGGSNVSSGSGRSSSSKTSTYTISTE